MNAIPHATPFPIKARLMGMMFLQYFVQGSYLPIIFLYVQDTLKFDSAQVGFFVSALAIGPLAAPFILGQLVDRYVAAQHVLAWCHFCAAGLMFVLYLQTDFHLIVILGTLYSVLYVPTMMLTNAVAFHHLGNREREFPWVRLWGTIGFVVPAWFIEMVLLRGLAGEELSRARGLALVCSAVAGLVMGTYCLTLPHTPPAKVGRANFAPMAVMRLLRRRDFAVLVVVCFLMAMVHFFHFGYNAQFLRWFLATGDIGGAYEQRISSIGQISEVAVMAGLGLLISRLGFKDVLTLGILAYLLRCLILAAVPGFHGPFWQALIVVGLAQALHGFCFGCFLAASFIYVDRISSDDVRGSMQTFYGTFVFGLGSIAGGLFVAQIGSAYWPKGSEANWPAIWLAPAILATLTLTVFLLLFPASQPRPEPTPESPPSPQPTTATSEAPPEPPPSSPEPGETMAPASETKP